MSAGDCPQCGGSMETYARTWIERGLKQKQRCKECGYQAIEVVAQNVSR